MSRMAKYKDLREGMKTDVISDEATSTYTVNQKEEPIRDADYYKRFLASEDMTQIKTATDADMSTTQPMTYDNVNAQVDEDLERALTKVREESGQEEYNTRMDILNKIRQARLSEEEASDDDEIEEEQEPEVIEEDDEDDDEDEEETSRRRFGFFKRHQEEDDDEDDEDDYDDDEDDEDEEDEKPRKRFGLFKKHDDSDEEDDEDEDFDDDDDDEKEGNSLFVKVLNVVIVILGLVLVALVAYIVKEFFL